MCGFKAEWQGGKRTRSILDMEVSFSSSTTILRSLAHGGHPSKYRGTAVHQAGELFQLFQHVILEVPFLTELPERFMKPGVLLQDFSRASPSTFPLKALAQSSPLNTYITRSVAQ